MLPSYGKASCYDVAMQRVEQVLWGRIFLVLCYLLLRQRRVAVGTADVCVRFLFCPVYHIARFGRRQTVHTDFRNNTCIPASGAS